MGVTLYKCANNWNIPIEYNIDLSSDIIVEKKKQTFDVDSVTGTNFPSENT